ncbi:flavodoxin family protein [Clostridium intestinale]|uniref:NADPH-dependent FMN reductase n=2 Tax=Clostridium intestinale TaxID=36845 RepID=U2PY59_9CLOT|nr:flavodoxin family protein [Clostridium intestinale]ERK31420.1 NADPH-dependent FMN reductase [Clostridium intestinale URNW]QLY81513.1 flavodoxin family protein [Clostridium intestinale]
MKTLILNGSPRKNGDTMTWLKEFINKLDGEYKIVNAYKCNINPCIDCRYCWENEGCCQKDEMQEVYKYIQECDNILIASPIYFSELTGQLLAIMSRLQTYWCARFFRKVTPIAKKKRGGVLLVGGGDGSMEKASDTAVCILNKMNAKLIGAAYSHNTESISPIYDNDAMRSMENILVQFNEGEDYRNEKEVT